MEKGIPCPTCGGELKETDQPLYEGAAKICRKCREKILKSPACSSCGIRGFKLSDGPFTQNICSSCAEQEWYTALVDLDEEATKTLRRRIEDCLRKRPVLIRAVAAKLLATKEIKAI